MSRVQTKCGLNEKMQNIDQIEEGKEKRPLGRHDKEICQSQCQTHGGNDLTIVEAVW